MSKLEDVVYKIEDFYYEQKLKRKRKKNRRKLDPDAQDIKEKILQFLKQAVLFVGKVFRILLISIKTQPYRYLFPITMIYFEVLLRICTGTGVFRHLIYPILFGLAAGFLFTFITSLFQRNRSRKISIGILSVVALFFTIECFVKKGFQWYLPISGIFSSAGDVAGNYVSEVFGTVLHGIPVILLFFTPVIFYVLIGKKYIPARQMKIIYAVRYLGYSVFFMLVAVGLVNIGSSAAKYHSQFKFDTATEYFGLLTSTRLEIKYSLFDNSAAEGFAIETTAVTGSIEDTEEVEQEIVYQKNEMDLDLDKISETTTNEAVKELNTYVSSLTASSQNEYTGLFEGKNLILICAEAFSDAVIDEKLTPTLYRMTHNGFYFSDYYQPTWGGSTSTGEFSFLLGLVPLNGIESMLDTQGNNLYFTLGNQLQREGYYSAAYHNGTYDYYSRQLTHQNLGYSTWTAIGNGLENITREYPGDEEFFDLTMDTYLDSEKPFSIYYMTVSGHCIYERDNVYTEKYLEQVKSIVGDKYKDTTTYYLCYQMELENALTTMIQKLEDAGIANDTVICLTSDHYPYGLDKTDTFGNSEDYVSDLYGYIPTTSWEHDRNSLIIWSGCLENENKDMACEITAPTYSLDIVPTLSNLFGLEYDSRLLVGRDVFSDTEPLVIWNTYSWVTDKGKYDSNKDEFYPNEDAQIENGYIEHINNLVANKITFSRNVINNDYYAVLFGEDDIK